MRSVRLSRGSHVDEMLDRKEITTEQILSFPAGCTLVLHKAPCRSRQQMKWLHVYGGRTAPHRARLMGIKRPVDGVLRQ